MTMWSAPTHPSPIRAAVSIPGSKSVTNRALILAALAEGQSTIRGALRSRDTNLMIDALRALGITITEHPSDPSVLDVTPGPMHGTAVDCGLAGTVMRFLPPAAALARGDVDFDGDPHARNRPQRVVLDALRALGASITGDALPFTVHGAGELRGGTVDIDASGSSQFVSGLLLSAARFASGVVVRHTGERVPSMPHIDMTVEMLEEAGVTVTRPSAREWAVAPGAIKAVSWNVEPDLSNATPFLAAAAVTGGSVTIPRWPQQTTQAGDHIRGILSAMGATVHHDGASLTVTGADRLRGIDADLGDAGELTPTVAALAALADSPSELRNIAHLRGHETDRLAALTAEIKGLGGNCEETSDGLRIRPANLHGGVWHAYADHRMATAGAIIGLRVHGIEVDDIDTTAKTLPGFAGLWQSMLDASTDAPERAPL